MSRGVVRRAVVRALALMTMLAVAVVTLPSATAATVVCCCGEHGAGHDCGCADCPAGHRGAPSATPSVKACRSHAAEVTLAQHTLQVAPVLAFFRDVATPASPVARPPLTDRLAEPPPSPPPRA